MIIYNMKAAERIFRSAALFFILYFVLKSSIICALSVALKTVLPATITFAPAALISATFSAVTPPLPSLQSCSLFS